MPVNRNNDLTVTTTPAEGNSTRRSRSSPTDGRRATSASTLGPVLLSRVTRSRTGTTPLDLGASSSQAAAVRAPIVTLESANSTPPSLASFVTEVPEGLAARGYLIEGTIGGGACAKIKKAFSVRLNKTVAIKVSDLKKSPRDVVEKFLPREVITLRELTGVERIVQLHESFLSADKLYMVLEYVQNGDLLDYICSRKRLSEWTSRMFYMDILSAMSACHKRGIIHRDIKCENVLIDANYRLKLADFGFARVQLSNELSRTYCGSLAYTAPEVILEKPYVGKGADVWSSGVVLYAMLSGRLPFNDSSTKAMIGYINDGVVIPSYFTTACRDMVIKILTIDPKKRLSIEQILQHPFMRTDPEKYSDRDSERTNASRAKR